MSTRAPGRLLDLALLLPLVPAFAVVIGALAAVVWLVDGRPIFFSQPRVGRSRRPFRIWKLRTMTTDADVSQRRPTRLGAWLRHRGLDELPQLFNVLRGDMRLVGPRPLEPKDADRLVAQHGPFAARFDVPPGLTGLAQVCQAQGVQLTARVDAEYAKSRTTSLDLSILVRTAFMNVVGKTRGKRPLPASLERVG
jgi:lipopolysaccharide/colanic/teichoic acid biosynthesis glycosyltransferase